MSTSLEPQHVIKGGGVLSVALAIAGCCVQDWKCGSTCNVATTGSADITIGTYLTNYVLAAMAAVMAWLAPSGDNVKMAMRGAFGLLAAACLCSGMEHQLFPDGKFHKYLWIAALICLGVGGLWRVYAALVAAQNAGYIKQWTDRQKQMYIFGGISVAYIVLIFLSYFEHISVPDVVMCVMHQSTFCLLLCIVAAVSEEIKWALAMLVSFGLATYVRISQPNPFKSNTKFNSTVVRGRENNQEANSAGGKKEKALMNCALMAYMVATFGLLLALYGKQTSFSKIENKADAMLDKVSTSKSGRRCCTCSFK